jgi:hypothetical protein
MHIKIFLTQLNNTAILFCDFYFKVIPKFRFMKVFNNKHPTHFFLTWFGWKWSKNWSSPFTVSIVIHCNRFMSSLIYSGVYSTSFLCVMCMELLHLGVKWNDRKIVKRSCLCFVVHYNGYSLMGLKMIKIRGVSCANAIHADNQIYWKNKICFYDKALTAIQLLCFLTLSNILLLIQTECLRNWVLSLSSGKNLLSWAQSTELVLPPDTSTNTR